MSVREKSGIINCNADVREKSLLWKDDEFGLKIVKF